MMKKEQKKMKALRKRLEDARDEIARLRSLLAEQTRRESQEGVSAMMEQGMPVRCARTSTGGYSRGY